MRGLRFAVLGLVCSIALFSARPANASLLLEPYLGYELGKLKNTGTPSGEASLSSAALGARLGVAFPIIFVAADYSLLLGGSLKDDPSGTKYDVTGNQLFAEVGAQLPLIRAYLGYGLLTNFEVKGNGSSAKYEGGMAIKAGVGTTIMPMFAVNLEYITSKYDKVGGVSTSDFKSDFFMLNISLPFEF